MTQKPKSKPNQTKPMPVKVKPERAQQLDVSQLQIRPQADAAGIQIIVSYAGHPIHVSTLTVTEYQLWQRMAPEQKLAYVRSKTNYGVFGNSQKIVNMVIRATVNLLDAIFAKLKAQTQRREIYEWELANHRLF